MKKEQLSRRSSKICYKNLFRRAEMYAESNDERTNHQIQWKIIRNLRLTGTTLDAERYAAGWHDGVRSSWPGQWYLLRRQRDVTDRELALWLRSSWGSNVEEGFSERGDTRSKRERRNSFLAYSCTDALYRNTWYVVVA
ncbi:uncharacterized protein LOC122570414 [Bombus pyrosoma]|uniref:uncharacterized protein LOC122570414 n=1 Tax=Bombus pyrosoma TaxID=396416 RepID=UPI001CB97380|nr:uncharacterized protein LOC122570414 [Bombus pyrosoma]